MITARPEKVTARPEVESACARASRRLAPGFALLAVAGEDEERVVDRDADPDHRGHVGDEDRGRHLQRDEVDERAGDQHADEAERQRQRRRGERAEDDEQDQRDDREAGPLGLREVFLGDFLHPRPDRRLPDQVGGDAGVRGARVEVFAQGRRGVDQLVGGEVAAQRHQRHVGAAASCRRACARRCRRQGDVVERRDLAPDPATAAGALGRARARLGLQHHGDPVRLRAELVLQRFAHRHRLAARHVEAAAGQVIGLFRGERQRQRTISTHAATTSRRRLPRNSARDIASFTADLLVAG